MTRYFPCILILAAVQFSCKKDHFNSPAPGTKQYQVSFNVAGFSQTVAPFVTNATRKKMTSLAAVTDTLAQHIDVLYYVVYDSNNVPVRSYKQLSGSAGFGTINIGLDPGSYHFVIAGGKTGLQLSPDTANQFVYNPESLGPGQGYLYPQFQDTFFKNIAVTVSNVNASYSARLDRVVAQLEVNIQDAIPSGAKYISATVSNDCNILKPDGAPEGSVADGGMMNNLTVGNKNTTIYSLELNTVSATSVDIKCYDQSNNVIAERIVPKVGFQRNKTTLLTGNLFGAETGNGIDVHYNPNWKVVTINYGF
jgi:hypothetical protein